ncbi:MAG: ankyrin repeat domain-containing protein [Proteobacteria bacterium]|nr:ankyrin repeat domain-containing protein [Pseudomonadota bacterium]
MLSWAMLMKEVSTRPVGIFDANIWEKLYIKNKKDPDFKDKILPKASELETIIKDNYNNHQNAKSATPDEISAAGKNIAVQNSKLKKLKRHHSSLTEVQKKEYKELIKSVSSLQVNLTKLKIEFNDQLTLTTLKAFLQKLSLQKLSYDYFINHGLNQHSYNKFVKLKRIDDILKIPEITIDGKEIGYPGIYLKKIKVEDELEAARACCLGKLTTCCQSLSGELGEPCVIHGLTSPYGGFYIVCKGDINAPTIDDELLGQCWVWRSQNDAIIFDSIEPPNRIKQPSKSFFEYLGKILVELGYTHKVGCGATSGISNEVGVKSIFNVNEYFVDYNDKNYCDSREQRVICDKKYPFYTFDEKDHNKEIQNWYQPLLQSREPLEQNNNLVNAINWALLENRQDLLDWLTVQAEKNGRVSEIILLIKQIENFVVHKKLENLSCFNIVDHKGATPLLSAIQKGNEEAGLNLIKQGADINLKNLEGETPLTCAVKMRLKNIIDMLVNCGAKIDQKQKNGESALTLVVKEGDIKLMCFLIEHGADISITGPLGPLMNEQILHIAIEHHQTAEIAIKLLDYNVDVNAKSCFGYSALHQAIKKTSQHPSFGQLALCLINKGADVNNASPFSKDLLSIAIESYNFDIILKLLEKGAPINLMNIQMLKNIKFKQIDCLLEIRILDSLRNALLESVGSKENNNKMLPSFNFWIDTSVKRIKEAKNLLELINLCKDKEMQLDTKIPNHILEQVDAMLQDKDVTPLEQIQKSSEMVVSIIDPNDMF